MISAIYINADRYFNGALGDRTLRRRTACGRFLMRFFSWAADLAREHFPFPASLSLVATRHLEDNRSWESWR